MTCLDCPAPAVSRGCCRVHYLRRYRNGGLGPRKARPPVGRCAGPSCDRAAESRGLCQAHYMQARTRGGVEHLTPLGSTWRYAAERRTA